MNFDPGLCVTLLRDPLGFAYGAEEEGPEAERRRLDDVRGSLMDPACAGPEVLYAIAMDVCKRRDREALGSRNLLFGVVTYARGQLGREPVRSQGHVHAVSPSCGSSTGELYEIWEGEACIYMQERTGDDPGRCYAVLAGPGEVVLVPPGWAHCTISAAPAQSMTFGAWCVRDYGFDYTGVRAHHGLAWFPVMENGRMSFLPNAHYRTGECIVKRPRAYAEFGLDSAKPIYRQFQEDPDRMLFIPRPERAKEKWIGFVP